MTREDASRGRWAVRLLFLGLVAVPVVVPWVGTAVDALGSVAALVPVGKVPLVRVVGVAVVALVVVLLVRQKRRSRGQRTDGADADRAERRGDRSERRSDREVDGTGEVYAPYAYNNQQEARRASRQIRERAEEIAEADREARKR